MQKYKPKVSVIIPVYNVEKYIRKCLDSVVNQTLKDIEIICIDDGSTDSSNTILKEYAERDNRIIIFKQKNKGVSAARNSGFRMAKGEYIGIVDSDDYVSLNYFEELYNSAIVNSSDIAATNNILMNQCGTISIKACGINTNDTELISINEKSNIIISTGICWNKIYKRSFINKYHLNFLEIKTPAEDSYFTDLAIICANKVSINNNSTYYYQIRNNSASQKLKSKSDFKVFKIYREIEKKIRELKISENEKQLWFKTINERKKRDFCTYLETMPPELTDKFIKKAKSVLQTENKNKLFAIYKNKTHNVIKIIGIKVKFRRKKSTKIKVLFCPSDNNAYSGAFLSMANLCKQLQNNFNITPLIVLPYEGSGTKLLKKYKLKFKIVKSEDWILPIDSPKEKIRKKYISSLKNVKALLIIIKIIHKNKIDIVHLNTAWGYIGGIAAILTGKPLVWHIREVLKEQQGNRIVFGDIGYKLINMATKIITISNAVLAKYPQFDKNKVKVIYNGINEKIFYNPDHNILTGEQINFICVGVIKPLKGQHNLIEACKLLADNGITNWKLNIIGGGQNIEYIKELITQYKLSDKICLLGKKTNVQDYLNESDIAFVPSFYEAWGRVTVEAMLSGCLVIASDSGGTLEVIEDNKTGLLHEVDNPHAIYEKILWAIGNVNQCRTIANAGRDMALQSFTAYRNAQNISNLYIDIIERKK